MTVDPIFPEIQPLKPLMEKRRCAWINASLEQLRWLLQQTPEHAIFPFCQNTRALPLLEKAEILEMTLQQLARLKKLLSTTFLRGNEHSVVQNL
ncbi:uncharacterized protein ACNFOS_015776 [Eudromia elegans]